MGSSPVTIDSHQLVDAVLRAKSGDRNAFGDLITMTEPWVRGRLLRLGLRGADLEDAASESYVEAWISLNKLEHPIAFPAWLLKTARRVGVKRHRKNRFEAELLRWAANLAPANSTGESSAEPIAAMAHELLMMLPAEQRQALALQHLHGLTLDEVAAAMGLDRRRVLTLVETSRNRLRARFPNLRNRMHRDRDASRR